MQMFLFFSLLLSWTGAFKNKVIVWGGGGGGFLCNFATECENFPCGYAVVQWCNFCCLQLYRNLLLFYLPPAWKLKVVFISCPG